MKVEEAIKKAISGGMDQKYAHYANSLHQCETLLDPSFWQSLGKALGWKGFRKSAGDATWGLYDLGKSEEGDFIDDHWIPEWQYRWHCFIDFLAEDGTAETFFKKI